jgi:hypothetical protein
MSQTRRGSLIEVCINCLVESRIASRGMCQPCYKRWLRQTPKDQREPVDRKTWKPRAFREAVCHPGERDKGHGLCGKCYQIEYRKKNRTYLNQQSERARLIREFGITPEQRDEMVLAQDGRCAICCNKPFSGRSLHIDHCHKTGKVRGLLCATCNWYLGKIDADPSILKRINSYRGAP